MKILIVRLSSIGDCVLASPVVEALRERYPQAEIVWAVQAKSAAVVCGLPGLSDTLLWDDARHRYRRLAGALWRTRRAHFDVALDLHGLDKAALFVYASGARRRLSGSSARRIARWSSTEKITEPLKDERHTMHAREFYLRRAAPLDIAPDAVHRFFPRVPVTALHRRFADEFLGRADFGAEHRVVGLNLGAAHAIKRWPMERYAALADTLLREDSQVRVVTFGGAADAFLLEHFEAELSRLHMAQRSLRSDGTLSPGNAWRGRVLTAVGHANLLQMAALAERCDAFVSGDTGPLHIAAAVGAPILALFGPTSSRHSGPVQRPGGRPVRVLDAQLINGAPVRVLDAQQIGDVPDAMIETHSVASVHREVRALLDQSQAPALRLLHAAS